MNDTVKPTPHLLKQPAILALIAVLLWTALGFGISMRERGPLFGHAYDNIEGALTAGSAMAAGHWYREGALRLRFAMYWEPPSVEYPTPESRTPYISFPPGTLLPLFILAHASGHPPSVSLVMAYNLATHCTVAFLLGAVVFLLALRWGHPIALAILFALPSPWLYLFLPGPYFEHQMGFFSDQAVMLPYALFLLLEIIRMPGESGRRDMDNNTKPKRHFSAITPLAMIQSAVMFWGVLTDWVFLLVVATVWIVRIAQGRMGKSLREVILKSTAWGIPALAALLLFTLQLHLLNAFPALYERFVERTETLSKGIHITTSAADQFSAASLFTFTLDTRFWNEFIPRAYGPAGNMLLLACSAAAIIGLITAGLRRIRRKPFLWPMGALAITAFALIPCFLYYHLLKAHCSYILHFFTTLKFALPLSLLPLGVFPAALSARIRSVPPQPGRTRNAMSVVIGLTALALALAYDAHLAPQRKQLTTGLTRNCEAIALFIRENTSYEDIVFTRRNELPHHFNGLSGKQTHLVRDTSDMMRIAERAAAPYVVTLFQDKDETYDDAPQWAALAAQAFEIHRQEGMRLLKISAEDFAKTAGKNPAP